MHKLITVLLILISSTSISQTKFAVIGDFGDGSSDETAVSDMIDSWNVDFVITLGDNNYSSDFASTADEYIGKDYNQWIYPYTGIYPGSSDGINKFFPTPGNHDNNQTLDIADLQGYLDFFTLPNNERYYDFVQGKIHFFSMNSIVAEPDGYHYPSVQATWLENKLADCVNNHDHWRLVYFHHSPYSSQQRATWSDWPYATFGAHAVLSGHSHTYERIFRNGIVYFVNGLGGKSIYPCGSLVEGSQGCYDENYGAQLVTAVGDTALMFEFYYKDGTLVDSYILDGTPTPIIGLVSFTGTLTDNEVLLEWETATETNNSGWDVERSFKRNNNFVPVDFVASSGDSNSPQFYSFTDVLSSYGKYHYRLKQISTDGSFFYSDEINVHYKRTTNEDTTPPRILQAALVDERTVDVEFSEPVTGADEINNYEIVGPQSIAIISVVYTDMIATLSTSEHIPGDYTITVNNVLDNAGNVIDPNNNSANYTSGGAPAVEMSYFNATLNGNVVTLDWETLSENGNLGWDVEESSKNTNNFTKIGLFVDGAGTINTPSLYTFNTSLSKYGKYYYRLKQISEGSFSYSENVLVDYKRSRNSALTSSPNPFNPQTTVTLYMDKKEAVKINVYNILGQLIVTLFDGIADKGEMKFIFNGQRLSSGTYVVVMQTGSSIVNHKVLLLK